MIDLMNMMTMLKNYMKNLSEKKLTVQTKKFLKNQKQATEKVLKTIMAEYEEQRTYKAKVEMAFALVQLIPCLMEKSGCFWFQDVKGGAIGFLMKFYTIKIL